MKCRRFRIVFVSRQRFVGSFEIEAETRKEIQKQFKRGELQRLMNGSSLQLVERDEHLVEIEPI